MVLDMSQCRNNGNGERSTNNSVRDAAYLVVKRGRRVVSVARDRDIGDRTFHNTRHYPGHVRSVSSTARTNLQLRPWKSAPQQRVPRTARKSIPPASQRTRATTTRYPSCSFTQRSLPTRSARHRVRLHRNLRLQQTPGTDTFFTVPPAYEHSCSNRQFAHSWVDHRQRSTNHETRRIGQGARHAENELHNVLRIHPQFHQPEFQSLFRCIAQLQRGFANIAL
jgi:hypothetical protein